MGRATEGHMKETQGELFREFRTTSSKKSDYSPGRDIAFGKKSVFQLSYENIVLLFIVFIMLLVIFFSLGVEKGKKIIRVDTAEKGIPFAMQAPQAEEAEGFKTPILKTLESETLLEAISEDLEIIDASDNRPYTIQVVAYKKENAAKKELDRLKREGHEEFVIPSNDWFQVCAGRYSNREASKKDLNTLKDKYPTCYFRKIGQ